MPICPHCGKNHPENARFCPKTGQPIDMPDQNVVHGVPAPQANLPANPPIAAMIPEVKKPGKSTNPLYILIGVGILMVGIGLIVIVFSLRNNPLTSSMANSDSPDLPESEANLLPSEGAETQEPSPSPIIATATFTVTPPPTPTFTLTPSPEPTNPKVS